MGSRGKVFNIGENAGILKYNLWLHDIEVVEIPPTKVKKYFTGKGNASKIEMVNVISSELDFLTKYYKRKDDSPIADIVDSFAIFKMGLDNEK